MSGVGTGPAPVRQRRARGAWSEAAVRLLKRGIGERNSRRLRSALLPDTVWPYESYLVNPIHDFIYCPIPKVGCTSLKSWFLGTLPDGYSRGDAEIHRYMNEHFSLATKGSIEAHRVLRTHHLFVVVRNPWLRAVSGYLDKFVREPVNIQNRTVIEAVYRRKGHDVDRSSTYHWTAMGTTRELRIDPDLPYLEGISFRQFVDYLCDTPTDVLDVHWKPQSAFLGGRTFHTVVRIEELRDGIRSLEDRLGIPRTGIPHLHKARKTRAPAGGASLAEMPSGRMRELDGWPVPAQLLTPDLAARIGERYAADVARFGYSRPEAR